MLCGLPQGGLIAPLGLISVSGHGSKCKQRRIDKFPNLSHIVFILVRDESILSIQGEEGGRGVPPGTAVGGGD